MSSLLEIIDIYGYNDFVNVDKKKKHSTAFGGVLTILSFCIVMPAIGYYLYMFFSRKVGTFLFIYSHNIPEFEFSAEDSSMKSFPLILGVQ